MKNSLFLILAATSLAAIAWMFWHMLGRDAFDVFSAIVLLILLIDNIRLRSEAKKSKRMDNG